MREISERRTGTPVRLPAIPRKGMRTLLITATTVGILGTLTWATPPIARAATSQTAPLIGNSPVSFKNVVTAKCLDDSSEFGLRAVGCVSGDNHQEWDLSFPTGGNVAVLKNNNTGRCVDDSSEFGLRAVGCVAGDTHQQWSF